MRFHVCAILLLAISFPARNHTPDDREFVARIGSLARAHRHAALMALSESVKRQGSLRVRMAYLVGRYYADPKTERALFVKTFPTRPADAFELYRVTPSVLPEHGTYPFSVLADAAVDGDTVAIRHLEIVAGESDGALGEFVSAELGRVAAKRPREVLSVLASLSPSVARELSRNPLPWCDSVKSVEGVRAKSRIIKQLQREIHASAARC